MLKSALKIKEFFSVFVKFLVLILICLAVCFSVVFPVWKFAVSAPRVYTFFVLAVIFAAVVFFAVRKILRKKNAS